VRWKQRRRGSFARLSSGALVHMVGKGLKALIQVVYRHYCTDSILHTVDASERYVQNLK